MEERERESTFTVFDAVLPEKFWRQAMQAARLSQALVKIQKEV